MQPTQQYPVQGNLPEIKVADLIKFLCAVTGAFPVQTNGENVLQFRQVEDVFDWSSAVDWTDMLLSQNAEAIAGEIGYTPNGWAQHNWWKWKEDETVGGDYDGSIDVDDETVDEERTVMTFPFAATDGNNDLASRLGGQGTQQGANGYKLPAIGLYNQGNALVAHAYKSDTAAMNRIIQSEIGQRIQRENNLLALQDKQKQLYQTIENFWLDATNNQQKFRAALATVESERQSYGLLQEKFNVGLTNIVELMSGKDRLLQAEQNCLQSKYMTILNMQMLKFYQGRKL